MSADAFTVKINNEEAKFSKAKLSFLPLFKNMFESDLNCNTCTLENKTWKMNHFKLATDFAPLQNWNNVKMDFLYFPDVLE